MSSTHIKVLQSHFVQSAQSIKDCFAPHCTEIAILGRSNVGKSSLINLLLNHKLAKSSSTPGKTKLINFFHTTWEISQKDSQNTQDSNRQALKKQDLNLQDSHESTLNLGGLRGLGRNIDSQESAAAQSLKIPLMIIDFPGFGYAKVSKDTRRVWDKHLSDFIHKRQSIKLFCHLIDSRHTSLAIDTAIREFLEQILQTRHDCKILPIYTKDDKLTKSEFHKLKAQQKLTISTLKKTPQSTQNLYHAILQASLDWQDIALS